MKMQCPGCGVQGSVNESFMGRKVRCPKCKLLFRIEPAAKRDEPGGQESVPLPVAEQVHHPAAPAEEENLTADLPQPGKEEERKPIDQEVATDRDSGGSEAPGATLGERTLGEPAHGGEHDHGEAASVPAPEKESQDVGPGTSHEEPITAVLPAQEPGRQETSLPDMTNAGQQQDHGQPLAIWATLSRAWRGTFGVKGTIWGASAVAFLILMIFAFGAELFTKLTGLTTLDGQGLTVTGMLSELLFSWVNGTLIAGIVYIAIQHVRKNNPDWQLVFSGLRVAGKLAVAILLQTLLIFVGFLLLILPGIYLVVGYSMTLPLIIDRDLSPWQAMELSRQRIHRVWWRVLCLWFLMFLVVMISLLPMGIGLIWAWPMTMVLNGLVYCHLFDHDRSTE